MAYCTTTNVTDICNTQRTTAEITALIGVASARVNRDIQRFVYKEYVTFINDVKWNTNDGSNVTFYTRNWPLGDYDNDFTVGTTDVHMYSWENNVETELTVSSITAADGKVVLSSAPSSGAQLYLTYCYIPKHLSVVSGSVSPIIRDATAYLTAWLCQTKIPAELTKSYTLDRLSVVKTAEDVHRYFLMYQELIMLINTGHIEVGAIKES